MVEIGCGTGKNTLLLSQIAEKVYAIDFSAYTIEKAKEKVRRANVIFMTADITKRWACSNGSADLITCNLVLEDIAYSGLAASLYENWWWEAFYQRRMKQLETSIVPRDTAVEIE